LEYFSPFPAQFFMSRAAATPTPPPSFEVALQELESIVRGMETGDASLEQSLTAYERGVGLLKHCQETLSAAEQKLQLLESDVLRDFEPADQRTAER